MRRLTKREVEALLRDYDDDPVGALSVALRLLLDVSGHSDAPEFDQLLEDLPLDPPRREALRRREPQALDTLAAELNEERRLSPKIVP